MKSFKDIQLTLVKQAQKNWEQGVEIQEGCILNNKLKFQYFIEFLIIWISDKNKAWTQVYYKWVF